MFSVIGGIDTVLAQRSSNSLSRADDDDTRWLAVSGTGVFIDSVLTVFETTRCCRLVTTVVEIFKAGRMIIGVEKHGHQLRWIRGNSTFQCPKAHTLDADKRPTRRLQSDIYKISANSLFCVPQQFRGPRLPSRSSHCLWHVYNARPPARPAETLRECCKNGQWVYRLYNILAIYISYINSTISYPTPRLLCCPSDVPSHQYYKTIYVSFSSLFYRKT